jgi:hypothetical protein
VIRVGSFIGLVPMFSRAKRRGSVYVRRRAAKPRRRRRDEPAECATIAVFDPTLRPLLRAPLPTAVLVGGATTAQAFVGGVRGWLASRAAWLRPRAIPMVVAFAGMLGVLASVNYLSSMSPRTAQAAPDLSRGPTIWLEPAAAVTIRVVAR